MGDFINKTLISKHMHTCTPHHKALQLHLVTGSQFHQVTEQVQILLHGDPQHQELVTLDIAPIGHNQIILRLLWKASASYK
jgi:hypothetical protein